MNDRVLVEALRAGDPGALAALYDAHAESVYRYCRCLLRDADSAQVALRDALIAAEAHAGLLADPGMLRPWLYALARSECRRRRIAGPQPAGEALAGAPEPSRSSRRRPADHGLERGPEPARRRPRGAGAGHPPRAVRRRARRRAGHPRAPARRRPRAGARPAARRGHRRDPRHEGPVRLPAPGPHPHRVRR
ncbi:RNA polymerase sigma factor [Nonomuraea ferruginea]